MTSINYFSNKVILITGGSGSFGTYATKRLLTLNPKEIRIFSRDAKKQKILAKKISNDPKVKFFIGNIQDLRKLYNAAKKVDLIIHAAANKFIDLCQEDPVGAIATNVIGTQNVIESALKNKVKFVINLSADKAVYPTGVYGATKQLSENLIITASKQSTGTVFVNLRYSNVIGSSGSVVEIFRERLAKDQTIEIFDSRAERLILTQADVWRLLEKAINKARGGEIFAYLAPKTSILKIAKVLRQQEGSGKIKVNKRLREGEKLGATLISNEEAPRTSILSNKIAVICPTLDAKISGYYTKFARKFGKEYYSMENAPEIKLESLEKMLSMIE